MDVVAVEGPASSLTDIGWWLEDDERLESLLRAIRRVEREPTLLGGSSHLFVAATRGSADDG